MTMTLNSILEIEHRYIDYQDERGLEYAEQFYQQSGAPSEPRALSGVLEKILLRLQSEGIPYPKILLKRRKQLQRHEWQPRKREKPESDLKGEPSSKPSLAPREPRTAEQIVAEERARIAEARAILSPEAFERWTELRAQAEMLKKGGDGKQ
jgi:hypothetical protein